MSNREKIHQTNAEMEAFLDRVHAAAEGEGVERVALVCGFVLIEALSDLTADERAPIVHLILMGLEGIENTEHETRPN